MTITVQLADGRVVPAKLPHADCAWVETDIECPSGGHYLDVRSDERRRGHDEYTGRAYCMTCKREVGTLRVKVATIFGLEEDEAVQQRPRVY